MSVQEPEDYKALWKQLRHSLARMRAEKRRTANKMETPSGVALALACEADGIEEAYWLMKSLEPKGRSRSTTPEKDA